MTHSNRDIQTLALKLGGLRMLVGQITGFIDDAKSLVDANG